MTGRAGSSPAGTRQGRPHLRRSSTRTGRLRESLDDEADPQNEVARLAGARAEALCQLNCERIEKLGRANVVRGQGGSKDGGRTARVMLLTRARGSSG